MMQDGKPNPFTNFLEKKNGFRAIIHQKIKKIKKNQNFLLRGKLQGKKKEKTKRNKNCKNSKLLSDSHHMQGFVVTKKKGFLHLGHRGFFGERFVALIQVKSF